MIVGTNSDWETEGNDRADFNLPANQNKLIESILDVNENTTLVINTGSPIKMPWAKKAKAIIQTWFAGQEYGNALFDILFGEGERNGINILSRRWPNNAVPYEIDSSKIAEGSAEETMIKQVVARFNSEMSQCINIV